jgi:hypothetical protein
VDRQQITLFPECLEDWICKDNPVRVIDVFVGGLGFAAGFGAANGTGLSCSVNRRGEAADLLERPARHVADARIGLDVLRQVLFDRPAGLLVDAAGPVDLRVRLGPDDLAVVAIHRVRWPLRAERVISLHGCPTTSLSIMMWVPTSS